MQSLSTMLTNCVMTVLVEYPLDLFLVLAAYY